MYNLNNDNGKNGNDFVNQIQSMAALVPYMIDPRNHKVAYNFSHYTDRFRDMPANSENNPKVTIGNAEAPNNLFDSHDFRNISFRAISTEIYFDYPDLVVDQEAFVEANLLEERGP